jgi:hypothetical protein
MFILAFQLAGAVLLVGMRIPERDY